MKLLRIQVKNLNSLYGEHVVDIERDLGGAPLFLIVGPTGSGKSTLMDAVSLALFGQTPRLRYAQSTANPDEDARNVVSHGTAEAMAQVDVQKLEGGRAVRYRATWVCRRARNRADGNLQSPRRLLERSEDGGQTWTTLVDDEREKFYGPPFAELLEGLTVTDFKRSMLLAQGDFAAFLKADEAERATILERLTDTSRYKDLGARAAQRRREAEVEKDRAEAALGSVQLLGEEEETALRAELERVRGESVALKARLEQVSRVLQWRQRLDELEGTLAKARAEEQRAQAAWDANRAGFDRLDAHTRCLPAAAALSELDRLRTEHQHRSQALSGLREAEATLAERVALASSQVALLHGTAETRSQELAAAAPKLSEARRLKHDLSRATSELQRATSALKERQATAARLEKDLEAHARTAAEADRVLELAAQAVTERESTRPLVEALAGLQARSTALETGRAALARRREALELEEKKRASARAEVDTLRAQVAGLAPRTAALLSKQSDAQAALRALVGDAADAPTRRQQLRARQEALAQRARALDEAARHLQDRARQTETLERLQTLVDRAEAGLRDAAQELEQVQQAGEALTRTIAALRQQRDDQRELQSYAKGRRLLEEGKECPLCGGTDHPSSRDPRFAELDRRVEAHCAELEANLAAAEGELQTLQARRETLRSDHAAATARCDELRAQLEPGRTALERTSRALEEALSAGGVPSSASPEALDAARASMAEETSACGATLAELEVAERAETEARDAARAASHELERTRTLLAEREAQLQAAGERATAARTDLEEETARIDSAARELEAELSARGIEVSGGIGAGLVLAAREVQLLRDADTRWARAREEAGKARLALAGIQERHAAVAAELAPASDEVDVRREATSALEAKLRDVLGGEDPDVVEGRLLQAKEQATAAHAEATRQLHQLQRDLAVAERARADGEKQLAELQTSRTEAEDRLGAALRALGLGDERALRESLLAPEEVARLGELRSELERSITAAKALTQAQEAAREEHLARQPDPAQQEVALTEELPRLSALRTELEEKHSELHKQEVLAAQKLDEQAALRSRLGELQQVVQEKQAELEVWERLHRLVGVKEGEEFKRYAQTLNLGELLARANGHLERLAPRYRLVGAKSPKGESRIAFAVEDAFHAGESRPVSTLSGGETFLVSLALALALASYRTVKMPIETLLLDEGFGTLDPETLQVAMAALEALNASGTQVGIISHVEALKERIPARVVVRRAGSGRSSVHVENTMGYAAAG